MRAHLLHGPPRAIGPDVPGAGGRKVRGAGPRNAVALTAAVVLVVAFFGVPGPAPLAARAAPATVPSSLTLESQSPAFVSTQNGVTLGIRVASALPATRLSLEVTLYFPILDRYTLRQTLTGSRPSLLTPLGNSGVIPLDLKALAWTPGSEVTLRLPVSAPDLAGTLRAGTGGVTLSILNCSPTNCGGVYPLQVSLLVDGVDPVASFTTYLIVTPQSEVAGTHPLRFAWVLPLGATPAISSAGTAVSDPSDLSQLETIDGALTAAPNAAVSLDLFPQFVEALESRPTPASQAALQTLRALAGATAQADILPGTFVPVDLDALVASGLSSAIGAQLARAPAILQKELDFDPHEYAANGPLDSASLGVLAQSGITRLVLPSASVQQLPESYRQWTPTTPFLIPGSAMEAMASDTGLEEDLASTAAPALKAQQMLADLSIQYFDNPGAPQAMAVESSLGTPLGAAFLQDVMTALSRSSIVHGVTLADIFADVSPFSSGTSPSRRSLVTVTPESSSLVPAEPIENALQGLAALASVTPGALHPPGRIPLNDLVLMAEGVGESAGTRQAYLQPILRQANSLAGLVSLPFGRTITMTSLQAKIPISIVSKSLTPFQAVLSVTSPELGFPHGHTVNVTIYPRTNIVPILLSARTSGDFSLQLTLATASGFTIRSGTMTIRSTAISGVAVALSIGAAAFLLVWWLRSILTKRRKKHKLRGAALAASAIPGGNPGA